MTRGLSGAVGWWEYAKAEAEAIRTGVGLIDATAFTKHLVRGPGATAFLDHFTCNKLPKVGRINLTYALTSHGTTRTEYTIVRLKRTSITSSPPGRGRPMTRIS
jgi:dimethylglycine dehydrogenase